MRLIDADELTVQYPALADILTQTPEVKNAVVLPFMPGDVLWYVDEYDGYRVKIFDDDIHAVAVYRNRYEVISSDKEIFPLHELKCFLTEEEAVHYREKLLSELDLEHMLRSIKSSNRQRPKEWSEFVDAMKSQFLANVEALS